FLTTIGRRPCSPLFPYTTLFRSYQPVLSHGAPPETVASAAEQAPLAKYVPAFAPTAMSAIENTVPEPDLADRHTRLSATALPVPERKRTRLNSRHAERSYADFCS